MDLVLKRIPPLLFAAVVLLSGPTLAKEQAAKDGGIGIISVPLANVRENPEPKAPLVTQVLLADTIRILEKRDYRYRIAIPNQGNRTGWIHQEAILIPKDRGRSYLRTDRPWIVISVPKTPALILDKLGNHNVSLYGGTRLPVVENSSEGYRVQFPDRTVAIIPSRDAMPAALRNPVFSDVSPADVAKTARAFLGVQYLSGGVTAQGMDTSGLVYIVYRIHGIDLDLDRIALAAKAVKVSKKDLLSGDILVFSGEGLGLFLGKGQYLHSPHKARVQIGGIHDRRAANSFHYGLRVLGADPEHTKRPAEMTADEIMIAQTLTRDLPLGKRIAYWAGRFIGTPYDADPLGLYVRTNRIVADEAVDCMYHTFRSVELAQTATPGEAIDRALQLRFATQGKIVDGIVTNYEERFQYGEDMVMSGKWGRNITTDLGTVTTIPGSRGKDIVSILPKNSLASRAFQNKLHDGDIVFWVKDPKKRVVEEIVAHLSIVRVKSGRPYVIHAAGSKNQGGRTNGGAVKEVLFADYVRTTRFIGAFITRVE
jgi:hypothetical protein